MKVEKSSISSTSYASAVRTYGNASSVEAPVSVQDSVEVSASAGLIGKAQALLAATPDIRTETVSGIQREFADGTYNRDDREVAQKVIEDYLDQA